MDNVETFAEEAADIVGVEFQKRLTLFKVINLNWKSKPMSPLEIC